MNSYELYEKVIAASSLDESAFNVAAKNWIGCTEEAPFEDENAKELYSKAKICYVKWKNKTIDGNISKQRMINYVREIAKMNLPNPYKWEPLIVIPVEEPKEESKVELVEEPVEEPKTIAEVNVFEEKKKEPQRVLGVVPEEKPHLFGKNKKRGSR